MITQKDKEEILRNAKEIHDMILTFSSDGMCSYENAFEIIKLALLADIRESLDRMDYNIEEISVGL